MAVGEQIREGDAVATSLRPPWYHRAARPTGLAAWFLFVAGFATWPLAAHLGDRVIGNLADPLENAWIFSWAAHALIEQPMSFFDGNIFFPEAYTFAYTENLSGLGVLTAPIYWLTGDAILQVNVATLLALAASGIGTYVLVRGVVGPGWVPLVAATAYTIAPYRLVQLTHPHVLMHLLPWVAVLLMLLSREVKRWRIAVLAALLAWQFWASLTGGLVTLFLISVWGVWELARRRREAFRPVGAAFVAALIAGVLVLPVVYPYLRVRDLHPEFTHPPGEVLIYSATPGSFLYTYGGGAVVEPVYDFFADHFQAKEAHWEKTLWPGFFLAIAFPLAAGAMATTWVRRRRQLAGRDPAEDEISSDDRRWWIAAVGLGASWAGVAAVMALGPRWGGRADGFPLPFIVVDELVPGGLMRAPPRFAPLLLLGMALAGGVGLAALGRSRRWVAPLAMAIVLIEGLPAVHLVEPPPLTAAHRALDERPGVMLFLPTTQLRPDGTVKPETLTIEAQHMYLATGSFPPMINGYAAFFPDSYFSVVGAVQQFPSHRAFKVFKARGIRTVVVQTELVPGTPWAGVDRKLEAWSGVRLVDSGSGVRVYDVTNAN